MVDNKVVNNIIAYGARGLSRPFVCPATLVMLGLLVVGCNRDSTDSLSSQNRASSAPDNQALIIQPGDSPTNGDSREPELNVTYDGRISLSWVEKVGDKRYALRLSLRDDKGWSEARTVAVGENWFVNWADFPSVIVLRDGSLVAHWLVKSGKGTYAYDVNIARSTDGGKSWTQPMAPHRDKTQTEHGFVSLIPLPGGRLGAVYLDGRNMKDMKDTDEHAPAPESMTLRYFSREQSKFANKPSRPF